MASWSAWIVLSGGRDMNTSRKNTALLCLTLSKYAWKPIAKEELVEPISRVVEACEVDTN